MATVASLPGPIASLPGPIAQADDAPISADYGSKLRYVFTLLRQFINVPDLANAKFSLPAQLLHPVPNLGRLLTQKQSARFHRLMC